MGCAGGSAWREGRGEGRRRGWESVQGAGKEEEEGCVRGWVMVGIDVMNGIREGDSA